MASNSLWHKVSKEEKEKIRKESKKLLNEFASKLSKIKAPEGHFENASGTRDEDNGWDTNPDFKDLTLLNAPFVEDDSIVAEKGSWKK